MSAKAAEGAATALRHSGQKKRYCGSWAAVSASLQSRGDPSRPGEMDHHDDTSGGHHHDDHDHGKLLMIIHGSLMLLGWGILLPLGILASIVRSRFSVGDDGRSTWLQWHRNLQLAGAAIGIAGAAVAKVMLAGTEHSHETWISLHHKVGGLLTAYLVFQVLLGLFRPKAPGAGGSQAKTRRRSIWEIVHKQGGANPSCT